MRRHAIARLPVDAQASTLNPSSTARVAATDTTRSLYESVGWLTESSLMLQLGHTEMVRRRLHRNERRGTRVEARTRLAGNRQELTIAPEIFGRFSIVSRVRCTAL